MSKFVRIAGAALVAIAVAVLAIHAATRMDAVQRWLGREVAAVLGPGVAVGVVDVSLMPPPGVRLREARIENLGDRRSIVEIGELGIDIEIGHLLRERELRVTAVSVDEAVVHVDLRSGRLGESLEVITSLFAGDAAASPRPAETSAPRALDLPVDATDVTVLVQPADERAQPVRLVFPRLHAATRRPAGEQTLTIDVDAELANGSLSVAITSTRQAAGRALGVEVDAADLSLREIFAEPPGDFQRASLAGSLRRAAGAAHLTGDGSLRLTGGVVSSASLGAALWKAVFGLLPGGGAGAAELVRSKPTVLESLSTRFALRERHVDLHDLELDADDYFVTGDGSVGFDSKLSMELQVQLTPSGLTKMLVAARLPLSALPVKKLPPIPLRVSGTMRKPIVRAGIDSLPAGVLNYGADAAEKFTKGVADAARGLLEKGAGLLDRD